MSKKIKKIIKKVKKTKTKKISMFIYLLGYLAPVLEELVFGASLGWAGCGQPTPPLFALVLVGVLTRRTTWPKMFVQRFLNAARVEQHTCYFLELGG